MAEQFQVVKLADTILLSPASEMPDGEYGIVGRNFYSEHHGFGDVRVVNVSGKPMIRARLYDNDNLPQYDKGLKCDDFAVEPRAELVNDMKNNERAVQFMVVAALKEAHMARILTNRPARIKAA